jgi:hypothetical protein
VIYFQERALLKVIERPAPGRRLVMRVSYVSSATARPGARVFRRVTGTPFKHDRDSAEAIVSRREVGLLYRGGELRQRMRCRAINSR